MSKVDEYRNNITLHLTRISSDLEHIKEKVNDNNKHLIRLNGRVRETEKQISWIKGIGSTFVFIIGAILTWLGVDR
jgi:predicted  nucleic acid-binding Zn-ribbon protein